MRIFVEYYDYDCGNPCTATGCPGHETNIPVAIELDGVRFEVSGFNGGDYPTDQRQVEEVQEIVKDLQTLLEKCNASTVPSVQPEAGGRGDT